MAANAGPKLVTGSMSFYIDAANKKSITTISNGWKDLLGNTPNLAFSAATFSAVNGGIVTFAGTPGSSASTTFNLSTDMTWDVWFKRNANVGDATQVPASNYNMVFESGTLPYFSFGWASVSPDRFIFSWFTRVGVNTAVQNNLVPFTLYSNNVWYNVTCTLKFDLAATTSTANMYVNGVLVGTLASGAGSVDTVGFQSLNGGVIRLATYNATGQYPFNGSISNLKIYRRILTATEIQQNYNAMAQRFQPDVAELAVLHLDAANRNSFTRVQDGWADLSTLQSTLLLSGAQYESKNGGVLTFAGTTGSFPTGSRATGNFTQSTEMTWDVWFNRTQSLSSEGYQFNMVFDHGNLPYLSFGTSNNASSFLFSWFTRFGTGTPPGGTQSQRTINTSPIYTDNTWYNVTCTLQLDLAATTSTARIYVNGVLAASQTTAVGTNDQIWPNSSTLRLATFGANSQYPFKGSISNFRIYRRILTDAEILQSYNALKARFGH